MLLLLGPDRLTDVTVTIGLFVGAIITWIVILSGERLWSGRHTARGNA